MLWIDEWLLGCGKVPFHYSIFALDLFAFARTVIGVKDELRMKQITFLTHMSIFMLKHPTESYVYF